MCVNASDSDEDDVVELAREETEAKRRKIDREPSLTPPPHGESISLLELSRLK
jgi:hypothetical protein